MNRVILGILVLSAIQADIFSQSKDDFDFILNNLSTLNYKSNVKSINVHFDGEIDYIFYGLFRIYKSLFSSQDMNVCNFHPSCSEFGLQALKRKGFIRGSIMTFDRMIRCNPFSLNEYIYDDSIKKFLDPVE